jgi:GNAT superfamily N-acetyltransferase
MTDASAALENGTVHAVGVEELGHLPFVRHQVDPRSVEGAWASGAAAVVLAHRFLPQGSALVATGFGPEDELGPLLTRVAAEGVRPGRVMVDADITAVPDPWRPAELYRWYWMLSTTPPPDDPVPLERVPDEDEVSALLDDAAPDSLARPGTPGVESWHGLRERGALVAVGALVRQPDGTGHLRAVTVATRWRGRGLGRALSTGLTRLAQAGTGVSSLGVYTHNAPAVAIYAGLGYVPQHTFTAGPVAAVTAGRGS